LLSEAEVRRVVDVQTIPRSRTNPHDNPEVSYDLVNSNNKPWLQYRGAPGTRPWAWWHLESHPPRERGESEAAYLTRHDLWLPGERELLEARNAEAKVVRLKR
jgi:hypothetical protein